MEEELSSLNIEISEAKLKNNEEKKAKQIKEEKNLGENTQPFDPKITSKFTFDKKILKINELSNNRLGILLPDSLLIYNLNNLKKIDEIQLPFTGTCYDDDKIFNFVELKNSDLVLLSSEKILFYKTTEKSYQLNQTINGKEESEKDKKEGKEEDFIRYRYDEERKNYEINSLYEMTNGKLVCCTSFGLEIYIKDKDKYILESKHKTEIDVRRVIEVNPNRLILLQRNHYFWWGCSRNNESIHTYSISIYDLEAKNLENKASNKADKDSYYGYVLISYLVKNGFLLVRYGNRIDIYDIKNNMKLVNNDQGNMIKTEEYHYRKFRILKDEMDIVFLCDYLDNLFIAKNSKNEAKIYMFEDNTLKFLKDFPFQMKDLKEIIRLKNNALIMYSNYVFIIVKQK
jgi:hypothetical protein